MENVNYSDSTTLQTGGQDLVRMKNHPHIEEVEILTLTLIEFEFWSVLLTLQSLKLTEIRLCGRANEVFILHKCCNNQ